MNNYRHIIISTAVSKIAELYILDQCHDHAFHDLQFGFIEGRSTAMAVSLMEDVTEYCVQRGSPVFLCSLDAERAFDGLPHSVLLQKAIGVIPDVSWRMLSSWYSKQKVVIKFNNYMSSKLISVEVGTRQGGLTSPFLFNLFYQEMIEKLSSTPGGLRIHNVSYNVFCYADDVLLASTTVTGLQSLINCATKYVMENGLCFNPRKTSCLLKGTCPFATSPKWFIRDTELMIKEEMDYLGVKIGNSSGTYHSGNRIRACRRAFFSLQGAGFCQDGVRPETMAELWTKACAPVLIYGCHCVHLLKGCRSNLDKLQGKLLKVALGIQQGSRTSYLLDGMRVPRITDMIDDNTLSLMRCVFMNNSRARQFYSFQLSKMLHSSKSPGLTYRVADICLKRGVNLLRYIYNDVYSAECKRKCYTSRYTRPGMNGVVDSVRNLLQDFNHFNRNILNDIVKAF